MGPEATRKRIESADLVLLLGVALTTRPRRYTARLDPLRMVRADAGEVIIRHHRYANVPLAEFVSALDPADPPAPLRVPGADSRRRPPRDFRAPASR